MAVLAVLSLGATVFVAQRALGDARDVMMRGEADALRSAVVADLVGEQMPPTQEVLENELHVHEAAGLRYISVSDPRGRFTTEAGKHEFDDRPSSFSSADVRGSRVRITGPLLPPRRNSPPETGNHKADWGHMGPPPLHLVIELEPPGTATLSAHLTRIAVTAAIAGIVLLAFAVAWSRSAARLAAIEKKAAREQRLVALGSMSSVMAHELRNPLASLKGHAQLLAEDLEHDPKKKAKADLVVSEAERLEVLTSSLLDFVRDGPIERAKVAPADVLALAVEDLAKDRVKIDVAAAPASISVDARRLARAVHNVVDNALQADGGADVEVAMKRLGDDVVVEVRDRGPGIPAGSESSIFEPFVTTRTRGTGLGLAVARRIAEQHGGTLIGENHPDRGAVFRLRFPST